jgi:hypothetical protein
MSSDTMKTKSMKKIEAKMSTVEPGSLRYQALECSKNFKSSWIALGQVLYTVYKDKMFKEWGYQGFETYCKDEVGIQHQTASKLLHSYYFLEKSEPQFLKAIQTSPETMPKEIPSVDAVNVLRLASNRKEFSEDDYQEFKKSVFEEGKDDKEVKKAVGLRLRSRQEEEDPVKARANRRATTLKRLIATVRTLEKEVVFNNLVSDVTAKEIKKLLDYLDKEIGDAE